MTSESCIRRMSEIGSVWTIFSSHKISSRRCSTSVASVEEGVVTSEIDGGLGAATSMTLSASSANYSNSEGDAQTILTSSGRRLEE